LSIITILKLSNWNKNSTLGKSYYHARINVDFEQDVIELILVNVFKKNLVNEFRKLKGFWRQRQSIGILKGAMANRQHIAELLNRFLILPVFRRLKSVKSGKK